MGDIYIYKANIIKTMLYMTELTCDRFISNL